mgnify:FL=1
MQIRYFREYSHYLDRFMEFKMYGHAGKLCFVFPCQDGRFFEWEDRHMYETVADQIEAGKIRFVACDAIDLETWSNDHGDPKERYIRHEAWMQYIIHELKPEVDLYVGSSMPWWVTGASMGATHAANLFFRFPDLFDGILALSGVYEMDQYYAGYHDEITYQNNPMAYLYNMDKNHPYIQKYNLDPMIFCVGQGDWETETSRDLRQLEQIFKEKGIHAWCDYWGYDVAHDWPWWQKQFPYFINHMLKGDVV